jgi:hypothetical protein
MADEPSKNPLGWAGVAVVAIVTLGVVFLTIKAIDRYPEAKDVAAVLAVVISPLAGVGAAAFGIKQSADAKAETKKVKSQAGSLADRIRDVVTGDGGQEVRAADAGGDGGRLALDQIEAELRRLAR